MSNLGGPIVGMKIEWAENPLASRVVLDERGRTEFVLRFIVAQMMDDATSIYLSLADPANGLHDPPRAISIAKHLSELGDDKSLAGLAERYHAASFADALLESHDGDCTCEPASCMKCYAEEIAGVDTIPRLGKHSGSSISGVFKHGMKIEDAIARLREPVVATAEWQHSYVGRWQENRNRAVEWLERYAAERLGRTIAVEQ